MRAVGGRLRTVESVWLTERLRAGHRYQCVLSRLSRARGALERMVLGGTVDNRLTNCVDLRVKTS